MFFLTYFDIVTSITSNLFFIHLSYTNIEDLHWEISKHWCYCPIHINNRIKSVCQNVYCCLHLKFFSIYFRNHKETKLSQSGIQTMQTMFMLTLNETCRVNSYFQPLIYSFSLKKTGIFLNKIFAGRELIHFFFKDVVKTWIITRNLIYMRSSLPSLYW